MPVKDIKIYTGAAEGWVSIGDLSKATLPISSADDSVKIWSAAADYINFDTGGTGDFKMDPDANFTANGRIISKATGITNVSFGTEDGQDGFAFITNGYPGIVSNGEQIQNYNYQVLPADASGDLYQRYQSTVKARKGPTSYSELIILSDDPQNKGLRFLACGLDVDNVVGWPANSGYDSSGASAIFYSGYEFTDGDRSGQYSPFVIGSTNNADVCFVQNSYPFITLDAIKNDIVFHVPLDEATIKNNLVVQGQVQTDTITSKAGAATDGKINLSSGGVELYSNLNNWGTSFRLVGNSLTYTLGVNASEQKVYLPNPNYIEDPASRPADYDPSTPKNNFHLQQYYYGMDWSSPTYQNVGPGGTSFDYKMGGLITSAKNQNSLVTFNEDRSQSTSFAGIVDGAIREARIAIDGNTRVTITEDDIQAFAGYVPQTDQSLVTKGWVTTNGASGNLPISSTDDKVTLSDSDGTFYIETGSTEGDTSKQVSVDPTGKVELGTGSTSTASVFTVNGVSTSRFRRNARSEDLADFQEGDCQELRIVNNSNGGNDAGVSLSHWSWADGNTVDQRTQRNQMRFWDESISFQIADGTTNAEVTNDGNLIVRNQVQTDTITTKNAAVGDAQIDLDANFLVKANNKNQIQVTDKNCLRTLQVGSASQPALAFSDTTTGFFFAPDDSNQYDTNGSGVAFTIANANSGVAPRELLRFQRNGQFIAWDGYVPQHDNSLVTKKYVDQQFSGAGVGEDTVPGTGATLRWDEQSVDVSTESNQQQYNVLYAYDGIFTDGLHWTSDGHQWHTSDPTLRLGPLGNTVDGDDGKVVKGNGNEYITARYISSDMKAWRLIGSAIGDKPFYLDGEFYASNGSQKYSRSGNNWISNTAFGGTLSTGSPKNVASQESGLYVLAIHTDGTVHWSVGLDGPSQWQQVVGLSGAKCCKFIERMGKWLVIGESTFSISDGANLAALNWTTASLPTAANWDRIADDGGTISITSTEENFNLVLYCTVDSGPSVEADWLTTVNYSNRGYEGFNGTNGRTIGSMKSAVSGDVRSFYYSISGDNRSLSGGFTSKQLNDQNKTNEFLLQEISRLQKLIEEKCDS